MPTRTTRALLAACAVLVLTCTGCIMSPPSVTDVQPASAPDLGVASPQVSAAQDLCATSTADTIDLLEAALDRIDRASSAAEIEDASTEINALFTQAGEDIGRHRGVEGVGAAVSELIVWASSATSDRPPSSASFAEGFLGSICDVDWSFDVELTPPAQVACAG